MIILHLNLNLLLLLLLLLLLILLREKPDTDFASLNHFLKFYFDHFFFVLVFLSHGILCQFFIVLIVNVLLNS